MSKLNELMERHRGRYQALFGSSELGELAAPPEIKAGYNAEYFTIHALPSRKLEGRSEKRAKITLKVKAVNRGFELLSRETEKNLPLRLQSSGSGNSAVLEFPETELLPEWEFEPSFCGDHILTLHFSATCGANNQLFHFSFSS